MHRVFVGATLIVVAIGVVLLTVLTMSGGRVTERVAQPAQRAAAPIELTVADHAAAARTRLRPP